jgi:hypothetical protein
MSMSDRPETTLEQEAEAAVRRLDERKGEDVDDWARCLAHDLAHAEPLRQWWLVHERSPAPGQWVEIGRIPKGGDTVQPLDKVWWHPINWNLNGMWWRDAERT